MYHARNMHMNPIVVPSDLHKYAEIGNCANLQLILKRRVDIDTKEAHGRTALMYAAFHTQIDAIDYLITNGADVLVKDDSGETALSLANQNATSEAAAIILHQVLEHSSAADIKDIETQAPEFFTPAIKAITDLNERFEVLRKASAIYENARMNNPLPRHQRSDQDILKKFTICINDAIRERRQKSKNTL